MNIQRKDREIIASADELSFTFLESGDLREITYNYLMINQVISNPLDGSMNNIYLRVYQNNHLMTAPLLGVYSNSKLAFSDKQISWSGEALGIEYEVVFTLQPGLVWFWEVKLKGNNVHADVIYGQDMGLADMGAVRTNEAYMSQYAGHTVFEDKHYGYVVCTRQNQPMSTGFPYIQQGSLTRATSYSTDGFQFFGLSYKETNIPAALSREQLDNKVYQYEFAYIALQSERVALNGAASFVFYGMLKPDHQEAITELEFTDEVLAAHKALMQLPKQQFQIVDEKISLNKQIVMPLVSQEITTEELERLFPSRHHEERDGNELLSFFTDTHEHIVLKAKELRTERPHGHILMSGGNDRMNELILSSTNYMYGVFHSQIVLGNTSFNKLMTNTRNALNILKTSGQRIYIEKDGGMRLLAMPSLYEIGFNYARWYYKQADDWIKVTAWTSADSPQLWLEVESEAGTPYRYWITNQISMNDKEYELPFVMEQQAGELVFRADANSLSQSVYPELQFRMIVEGAPFEVSDERTIAPHAPAGSASLVVLKLGAASNWRLAVSGQLSKEQAISSGISQPDVSEEITEYRAFLASVMNNFSLTHPNADTEHKMKKFNALAWWYTHNMLVHYSVPHGLEQYSGAAWGTRDVCQGPVEYFMATGKYEQVKEIMKTVYTHQYEDEGNWPQWFMFDQYYRIKQEESHGDIIVWPLKVIGDYLRVTGDFSILLEKVPYTKRDSERTTDGYSIFQHIIKELAYIKEHFLHQTRLSSYGDGDWDDTLQPANSKLKQYMISSWTVSLTYQVFSQLSEVLEERTEQAELMKLAAELKELAAGIKEDINQFLIKDGIISGFAYMEQSGQIDLMLHPSDDTTGIKYRLLPMTRSMIGQLFDTEQAEAHYQLIKQHLYCPDGVRLMNHPAAYTGGVSRRFKRAEQAANFGREVGLQYVHAHIRFIEAMAKLGKSDEVWRGLEIINPVGLQEAVPNADFRQSNAYFSSSDGKFDDRYKADAGFGKLRTGDVPVKGGWRIYSSGPGIYMNQLISNSLGIRQLNGDLVLDPVLPAELDGLRFRYQWANNEVEFVYSVQGKTAKRVVVNGTEANALPANRNKYRSGGIVVAKDELQGLLQPGINEVKIILE